MIVNHIIPNSPIAIIPTPVKNTEPNDIIKVVVDESSSSLSDVNERVLL